MIRTVPIRSSAWQDPPDSATDLAGRQLEFFPAESIFNQVPIADYLCRPRVVEQDRRIAPLWGGDPQGAGIDYASPGAQTVAGHGLVP
jgi:hypothetical protein